MAGLQLALLVLWAQSSTQRTKASIPASVLSLVGAIVLAYLSYVERTRTVRPSALITLYLLVSIVLDLPQARTLWLRGTYTDIAGVFTATLALKATALLLEARGKRHLLSPPYNLYPPEALSGLIARSFLWWINPLFLLGYRAILRIEQLFNVDDRIESASLSEEFNGHWAKSAYIKPMSKH